MGIDGGMDADAADDGKLHRRRYICDWRLARRMGIYQMLDPYAAKWCGYNAYHVLASGGVLCLASVCALCPLGLRWLAGEANFFTFYLGCVTNLLFSCYKVTLIVRQSADVWRCADITRVDYVTYRRYDRSVYRRWRARSTGMARLSVAVTAGACAVWIRCPVAFRDAVMTVRRPDGRPPDGHYRMNVFNMYVPATDAAYNAHYGAFFAAEILLAVVYFYFTVVFEVLLIMMCTAFSCHLDAISDAIQQFGHDSARSDVDNAVQSEKKYETHDEFKMILKDHQKVLKKMSDFYKTFWTILLTQIFVASYSEIIVWFIFAMSVSVDEKADSILSVKMFTIFPMTTFQLFFTCYLFDTINEKKDSVIFSLYSSNWVYMNTRLKKLILFSMKMNNANQLKIKFTNINAVNLEMFTKTMRASYSLFSMLINYNKNKIN